MKKNHPRTGLCFLFPGERRSSQGLEEKASSICCCHTLRASRGQEGGGPEGTLAGGQGATSSQATPPTGMHPEVTMGFWKTEGLRSCLPQEPALPPASPCPQTLCFWQHTNWMLSLNSPPCERDLLHLCPHSPHSCTLPILLSSTEHGTHSKCLLKKTRVLFVNPFYDPSIKCKHEGRG